MDIPRAAAIAIAPSKVTTKPMIYGFMAKPSDVASIKPAYAPTI